MKIKGNLKVDNGQINSGVNQTLHSGATNSAIIGGANNTVNSNYSLIGGGKLNLITGGTYGYNFIGGGGYTANGNQITDSNWSSIIGGYGHQMKSGGYSSVVGGIGHYMSEGFNSTIGGGHNNSIIYSQKSFIGSGYNNKIEQTGISSSLGEVIVGGQNNKIINSQASAIVGGQNNSMTGTTNSFIAVGNNNVITGNRSSIVGENNSMTHDDSHIIGTSITSVSANTTHVEKLNVGTLNGTASVYGLGLDVNGMVVSAATAAGGAFTHVASGQITPTNAYGNTNTSDYSSLLGGKANTISIANSGDNYQLIGGGSGNTITTNYIKSGFPNIFNTILNGSNNYINATNTNYGTAEANLGAKFLHILGGESNLITGTMQHNIIGGGYFNRISGATKHSVIGGGFYNHIDASVYGSGISTIRAQGENVIAGGSSNYIIVKGKWDSGPTLGSHVIGGGMQNTISGNTLGNESRQNVIGGGRDNAIVNGSFSSVAGGYNNTVNHDHAHVIGSNITSFSSHTTHVEQLNIKTATLNVVPQFVLTRDVNGTVFDSGALAGGKGNVITSSAGWDVIGGGTYNTINGSGYANIGGGYSNEINANNWVNTIAGGYNNEISGSMDGGFIGNGSGNRLLASNYSSIVGGSSNTITGSSRSFIGGGNTNTVNSGNDYSSIIGGQNNINNHVNSHIIGSNITSVSANTTHVEKLNIGTLNGTALNVGLGLDANGMVVSGSTGGGAFTHTASGQITPTNTYGNTLASDYSSVLGGGGNIISSANTLSVIGGGSGNTINQTGGPQSGNNLISGGYGNRITGYGYVGTNVIVGGGGIYYSNGNLIDGGSGNVIVGGGLYDGNVISGGTRQSFIGGGDNNVVKGSSSYQVIVGGKANYTDNGMTFIGGGQNNTASGLRASVVGGEVNTASGEAAFVGGGSNNTASGLMSSVVGGQFNTVTHANAHIVGSNITSVSANTTHVEKLNIGTFNGTTAIASLSIDTNGMVVSGGTLWAAGTGTNSIIADNGTGNVASSSNSFASGVYNSATTANATVIGGGEGWTPGSGLYGNIASGKDSVIVGGWGNIAAGDYATGIFGGYNNTVSGASTMNAAATVGGAYNAVSSYRSVIAGGSSHIISVEDSFIGAGNNHDISGRNSAIIGGTSNVVSAVGSVVLGGQNITGDTADTVYVPNLNINGTITSSGSTGINGTYNFATGATGDVASITFTHGIATNITTAP